MKLIVFGEAHRLGIAIGDSMADLNHAAIAYLAAGGAPQAAATANSLAPSGLAAFIEAGEAGLDLARQVAEWLGENPTLLQPLSEVQLQATWPGRRIAAAGANFADHFAAGMTNRGHPMTPEQARDLVRSDEPLGYWKVPGEAVGSDGVIPLPARCPLLDFEGEVAIIIGRRGKDIPLDEAMSYVWGTTVFNDWSLRTPPRQRLFPFSLNLDKNFDGGTSCGPAIAFGLDPAALRVVLRVNGEVRQDFNTRDMVYSFAEYIHFLSRDFTLLPGDMIVSGTGSGTGADSSRPWTDGTLPDDLFLKAGDAVEVEVDPIGILRNHIVER